MSTLKKDETSAYLTLIEGKNEVDRTIEVNESVHLDFDKQQNILGIEVLDYSDAEIPVDVLSGKYGIAQENIDALLNLSQKEPQENTQPEKVAQLEEIDPLSSLD